MASLPEIPEFQKNLTIRYREQQERERGKLQGLFDLATSQQQSETMDVKQEEGHVKAEPKDDSEGNLQSDFKKRLEFFEQMVRDGGLEISPEHGALVAALKNGTKVLSAEKVKEKELTTKEKTKSKKIAKSPISSPQKQKDKLKNKSKPEQKGQEQKLQEQKLQEQKLQDELQKAMMKKKNDHTT